MKKIIVKVLARVLPDVCVFERLFGISLCKLNPFYKEVMLEKAQRLGY